MTAEKQSLKIKPRGGKRIGAGRKPGVPNKITAQLKDLILQSLANQGGVGYLDAVAVSHPAVFVALLGRILPLQVTGRDGQSLFPAGGVVINIPVQPDSGNRT